MHVVTKSFLIIPFLYISHILGGQDDFRAPVHTLYHDSSGWIMTMEPQVSYDEWYVPHVLKPVEQLSGVDKKERPIDNLGARKVKRWLGTVLLKSLGEEQYEEIQQRIECHKSKRRDHDRRAKAPQSH